MIERYSLSPMKEIWTQKAMYERWLEVEIAVVEGFEYVDGLEGGISEIIREKAEINVEEIEKIEEDVNHDVIAFIKSVTAPMGDEARYFHKGITSSDVVDTALSLGLKKACEIILSELEKLDKTLTDLALKYKNTITVGRTHGIHAEPTSFGLKFLGYLTELRRNIQRIKLAKCDICKAKLSGAVGNYANISPAVENCALNKLGLTPVEVSTQVVPRDIHAFFLNSLALLGSCFERITIEIRHLQRTEVGEAFEPFAKGQRGSSAMPHKRNPIICERISGMARLLRSYSSAGLENVMLWHERDISHSSAERVIFPDACIISHYMAVKMNSLLKGLVVDEDRMIENFKSSFNLVYSQRVLLSLIESGMSREEAYKLVQKTSMTAFEDKKDFKVLLHESEEVKKILSDSEIEGLFDPSYYLKNIAAIYSRVLQPNKENSVRQ